MVKINKALIKQTSLMLTVATSGFAEGSFKNKEVHVGDPSTLTTGASSSRHFWSIMIQKQVNCPQ